MKKHFDAVKSKNCESCSKCYKCVKTCPVNAIKIKKDIVFESADMCIDCGTCYGVCHKGVHLTDFDVCDFGDYVSKHKTILLLDSTYFMKYNEYPISVLEKCLNQAGFDVVETAFDGLAIHDMIVKKVYDEDREFYFNSNCIPFISYIEKYCPELTSRILPYKTANEISGMIKRNAYGTEYKIILVTSCFGDYKLEQDGVYIDKVILSTELEEFMKYKNIDMNSIESSNVKRDEIEITHYSTIAPSVVSGMSSCLNVIDYAHKELPKLKSPLRFFICNGACFNSKSFDGEEKPFEREQRYVKYLEDNFNFITLDERDVIVSDFSVYKKDYTKGTIDVPVYSKQAVNAVLDGLNISTESPQYDCDSCGYGSCENFAIAVLNDRANERQCASYMDSLNKKQSLEMEKMISELNEAFSLTIPDGKLENKLKNTPIYIGVYDDVSDCIEIVDVIKEGLYLHIINCLKLAADLKDYNIFDFIGIDKGTLVQSILYHCNAKSQPVLSTGDIVKYSDIFEDKKEEALRSSLFAKKYYNVSDEVASIIKYHKHEESEIPVDDFPKHLFFVFRLFRIIDMMSSVITKSEFPMELSFEFVDFILNVYKYKNGVKYSYQIDLYKKQQFSSFEKFLKE